MSVYPAPTWQPPVVKIIGTMWIDTNKGDIDNPEARCRLIGKKFRPLEALRLIISRAVTLGPGGKRSDIMINDVCRVYFYAKCTRDLYVELPAEDLDAHPDFIGKLIQSIPEKSCASLTHEVPVKNIRIRNELNKCSTFKKCTLDFHNS